MKSKLNINESFICRIWEGGSNYFSNLLTTDNEPVVILDAGKRNYDGGPDYKNAKVRIGTKTLTGDIEVHRDFSGWAEHNHSNDRKYIPVVLQVVMWDSKERTSPKLRIKRDVSTVILSKFLNQSIHKIWREIIDSPSDKFLLPCYGKSSSASDEEIGEWFSGLSIERLNMKTRRIKERLTELGKESTGSRKPNVFIRKSALWEQVFYEYALEALGFSKNKEPMLKLAENLPLYKIKSVLSKSGEEQNILIQSLLFGSSGMLFDVRVKDDYVNTLKSTWENLKAYFKVPQQNKSEWHFFRLRPQNFPTLRLAYASQLIGKLLNENLFRDIILEFKNTGFSVKECSRNLFELLFPGKDEYWSYHYNFGKTSKSKANLIGKERINDVIINVIIPVVYLYSVIFEKKAVQKNVMEFYNSFKFNPSNSVLDVIENQVLKERRIKINTPALEQAAIQLYNFHCIHERCSKCPIGEYAFKNNGYEYKIIFY
jgi:hypothetical protein